MALCQWDFKHLEVVGTKYSCPPEWAEIRGRIPQLKVETRKYSVERKESHTAETQRKPVRSSTKQQSLLHTKPPKEKVVTVKVVLPKRKAEVLERNYLCTCQLERNEPDLKDVEEIEFNELMKVLLKYSEGPRKESSNTLKNVARGFQGSRILSSDEVVQVCISQKDNLIYVECDLILFAHLHAFYQSGICLIEIKCQLDSIIVNRASS